MLIRMAIVEDSIYDQREAKAYVGQWSQQSNHDVQISVFDDSDKLLGVIDDEFEKFDVYLLDIEMKTPHEGLDLAKAIRKKYERIPIIFITSHTELAIRGWDVHALHFLGKPIDEPHFFATLDRLAAMLQSRKQDNFVCTIEGEMRRFLLYEIRYITSDIESHYLLLNGDKTLRFRGKLSDIAANYAETMLICHQSYLVNIEHVRTLNSNMLTLSDGMTINVSKANLANIRKRFAEAFSINPVR